MKKYYLIIFLNKNKLNFNLTVGSERLVIHLNVTEVNSNVPLFQINRRVYFKKICLIKCSDFIEITSNSNNNSME